ncbi:hypothetical protein LCGC14_2885500, partial [marine sediment metagenome]
QPVQPPEVSENKCLQCKFWTDGCFKDTDSPDCFQYSMLQPKSIPEVSDGEVVCCATCTLMKNDRCGSKEKCYNFDKHIYTPYQSHHPQPISEERIEEVIVEVERMHPYKKPGARESYYEYAEGWSDACDILGERFKAIFTELGLNKD